MQQHNEPPAGVRWEPYRQLASEPRPRCDECENSVNPERGWAGGCSACPRCRVFACSEACGLEVGRKHSDGSHAGRAIPAAFDRMDRTPAVVESPVCCLGGCGRRGLVDDLDCEACDEAIPTCGRDGCRGEGMEAHLRACTVCAEEMCHARSVRTVYCRLYSLPAHRHVRRACSDACADKIRAAMCREAARPGMAPCKEAGCEEKADRGRSCSVCRKRVESCAAHLDAAYASHVASHPRCVECEAPTASPAGSTPCNVIGCALSLSAPTCGSTCTQRYHGKHHRSGGSACQLLGCMNFATHTRTCQRGGCSAVCLGCCPAHADDALALHTSSSHAPPCLRDGCDKLAAAGAPCPVVGCSKILSNTCGEAACGVWAHDVANHRNGVRCQSGVSGCRSWAVRSFRCAVAPHGSGPCGQLLAACSPDHLAELKERHAKEHEKKDGRVALEYDRKLIDQLTQEARYPLQDVLLALATLAHEGRSQEGVEGVVRELSIYAEQRRALGAAGPPPLAPAAPEVAAAPKCITCEDAPRSCVYVGCGHMPACYPCASKMPQCPICRKESDRVRVFGAS